MPLIGCDHFGAASRRFAAEHHQVQQRVGTQPVRAMHRYAGRFTHGHQPRDDRLDVAVARTQRLAVIIAGDAAHVVVHGRQHRDRRLRHIHIRKNPRGLGNAGQTLVDDGRA